MTRVSGQHITVAVGRATLIADVTIDIAAGMMTAIVGPNGAGKTTLLRALAGETVPTSGTVELMGRPIDDLHPAELALLRSYLPHSPRPDIPFSVRQVVALGRHPHRSDPQNSSRKDDQSIRWAMGFADVAKLADRRFASLSGGEQMRASIARAIAQDTPVLFFDEPTAPLDLSHQDRALRRLGDHAHTGRTVVIVLHDLNAAAAHADRVVLMSAGRVAAEGSPREVFEDDSLTKTYDHPMRVIDHPFRADQPLILPDVSSSDISE